MPDGSVKHLHAFARALTTPSGNLEFVGAVTDVTEQVQAQTALENALQEIERRDEALRGREHSLNLIINTIPELVCARAYGLICCPKLKKKCSR